MAGSGSFLRFCALAFALCCCLAAPVRAADGQGEAILTGFALKTPSTAFEAEMRFVGAPRTKVVLLANPNRVAVDFYDTVTAVKAVRIPAGSLVAGMRQGLVASDRFRIVFELARPGLPRLEATQENGRSVVRLRIEETDAASFRRAVAAAPTEATPAAVTTAPVPADRTYTVVVDAGHGGVDTGAVGRNGTLEKDVNLKFAQALREALGADNRIRVLMTRDDDTFISLAERSQIARRAKANLFVSMHSDSIRYSDLRGASVYTLSEKASDSLARDLADSENSADRFVDPEWRNDKPEVFDILIELMRRETETMSDHFAGRLVRELGRHDIRLITNPKRSAGFKVLTAPDVPSVLLEIGYLSNVDDEQLLSDESWRKDTANAIASAIRGFLSSEAVPQASHAD